MNTTTGFSLFTLIRNFDNLNHRAILETLAKIAAQDPVLFCRLADLHEIPTNQDWTHRTIAHLKAGDTEWAIREVRIATGMGLKESKNVIDMLCHGENYPADPVQRSMDWYKNFVAADLKIGPVAVTTPAVTVPMQVYCVRYEDDSIHGIYRLRATAQAILDRGTGERISSHYLD